MRPFQIFVMLFVLSAWSAMAEVHETRVREITAAEYFPSAAATPPAGADWQPIDLPYVPRGKGHIENPGAIWFRFPLPAETRGGALYISRHNVSLEIFLDDLRIGGQWQDADPPPIGWNRPTLVDLPARERVGYVYIRLQSGPHGSMLSAPLVGPAEVLHPMFESRFFWQVEVSQWMFLLSVTVGGFALLLWNFRRRDYVYLRFVGAATGWTFVTLYLFLDFIPIPLDWWLGVVHTGLTWTTYFMVTFMLGAAGSRMPRLERALLVVSIIATFFHFVYPPGLFFLVAYGFHAVGILVLLGVGIRFMLEAVRQPGGSSTWFSLAFVSFFLLAAHDWYYFLLSPVEEYTRATNLMQLSIPIMLAVLFLNLITRFARALNETERLNQSLEARVALHKQALDESYEHNRQLEIREAATAQREKIYRDLHDDVGARLTSIIYTSPEESDVTLAREALDSLREAIYRANYHDQPAAAFVDRLVEEARLRVETAGLGFHLEVGLLPTAVIPADTCYHVMRICRELVSNILHHARASVVTLRVEARAGEVVCELCDNGVGMAATPTGQGGVAGIRQRAVQIGARVAWRSAPGQGTSVDLHFPVGPAIAGAPERAAVRPA